MGRRIREVSGGGDNFSVYDAETDSAYCVPPLLSRRKRPVNASETQRFSTNSWQIQELLKLSGQGVDFEDWLTGAESSVEFLKKNTRSDRIVLYSSLQHVLIQGVLAPLKQLKNPDQSELGSGPIKGIPSAAVL